MPLAIGIGLPLEFNKVNPSSIGPPTPPTNTLLDEDSIDILDEDSVALLEE